MDGYRGLDPAHASALVRSLDRAAAHLEELQHALRPHAATVATIGATIPGAIPVAAQGWAVDAAADLRRRLGDLAAVDAQQRAAIVVWLRRSGARGARRDALLAVLADSDRTVLHFDPAGDGRLVEAIGDPATARHVVVLVPGMGSSLANDEARVAAARALRDAAQREDPDTTIAVIVWLGYDTPDTPSVSTLDVVLGSDESVVDRTPARRGAVALVDFVRSLRRQRADPALEVTVIGHSYGSLVVGDALRAHLPADHAVVIGSPGMGADSAGALHLAPGTDLYAARLPFDPVASLAWFGPDPTDPAFGARAFATQRGNLGPDPANHSAYFDRGSESLRNLARIAIGHGDEVTRPASATDGAGLVRTVLGLEPGLPLLPGSRVVTEAPTTLVRPISDAVDEHQEEVDLGPLTAPANHAVDGLQWIDRQFLDPARPIRDAERMAFDWLFG